MTRLPLLHIAHQARHRDHRRKPQLRPRLRDLSTKPGKSLEPAVGRNHQGGRHARPQLPHGTTDCSDGSGTTASDTFLLSPPKTLFPGNILPAPLVGGAKDSYIAGDSLTLAEASENGLPSDYYQFLISGGTGLTSKTPDTRITNVKALPAGPFQLTNDNLFTYNSYAASPVHRFYQMWQQLNCSADNRERGKSFGLQRRSCFRGSKSRWVPAQMASAAATAR